MEEKYYKGTANQNELLLSLLKKTTSSKTESGKESSQSKGNLKITTTNDVLKQAKLLTDQFARTEKNANTLNAQYRLQTDILGKTREETERLNAISKLGSGATLVQISSVMSSINAFQQRRAAVEAAEAVDAAYDAELKQQIAIAQQTASVANQLTEQYKLQAQQVSV